MRVAPLGYIGRVTGKAAIQIDVFHRVLQRQIARIQREGDVVQAVFVRFIRNYHTGFCTAAVIFPQEVAGNVVKQLRPGVPVVRTRDIVLRVLDASFVQLLHEVHDAAEAARRRRALRPAEVFFACADKQLCITGYRAERVVLRIFHRGTAQYCEVTKVLRLVHINVRSGYAAHGQTHHCTVFHVLGYVVVLFYERDDVVHQVLTDGLHIPAVIRRVVHRDDDGGLDFVIGDCPVKHVLYAALVHPFGFLAACAMRQIQRLVGCAVFVIACREVYAQITGMTIDIRVRYKRDFALRDTVVLVVIVAIADYDHALGLDMSARRVADRRVRGVKA